MDNKYGLMKSNDQMFGNEYYTELPSGKYIGKRPIYYFGVSALVLKNNKYYLMGEDDGHFWTEAELTIKECQELKDVIQKIDNSIIQKPNSKYSLTNKFRKNWKHNKFPATVEIRHDMTPLIKIKVKDSEISFDTYWTKDYIKTLTIE